MLDPRIGIIGEDGVREWPKTDIDGEPYVRPINEVGLGKGFFAVFSINGITDAQREELLAVITPAPKGKRNG